MNQFDKKLIPWFDLTNYDELNDCDEKKWIELLLYRYTILSLLSNPNKDKMLGASIASSISDNKKSWREYDETASSIFFEVLTFEPVNFTNNLGKLRYCLQGINPQLHMIWEDENYIKNINSVTSLTPFEMSMTLSEYNFRDPVGYVIRAIDKLSVGELENNDPIESPEWFHMPFHLTKMYDICQHGKIHKRRPHPPTSYIAINLSSSKNKIVEDFKKLIDQLKLETRSQDTRKRIRNSKVSNWVKCAVLPYSDLLMWQQITNTKIPNNKLIDLLFNPDEYDDSSFWKTTKKTYKKLFPNECIYPGTTQVIDELIFLSQK